jgi:hypothetical protein
MASCGSATQRRLCPPVALQPSAGYGLLWLCSTAQAMASCGSAAQRGLWPPVAAAQRGLWPPVALQPSAGYGLLVSRGFVITHNDAPQSVGHLWTSDRRRDLYLTTHTTDKHPCARWDSNSRLQQASGRRPTPQTGTICCYTDKPFTSPHTIYVVRVTFTINCNYAPVACGIN